MKKSKELLNRLTLDDKARLCSGKNFWELESVLDLPSIMVTDGPHGLRKQAANSDNIGLGDSVEAICYPTAVGLASTWDNDLIYQVGEHLGEECQTEKVSVLLGPGANIKRHPLCGRNFEYLSEDPFLSGHLAASMIQGVQSKGIGTSMKHFVANNQESMRMAVDTFVDERTLREIYLKSFEIAVKEAQPWTIMCSYNKLNGTYLSENKRMLETVLKDEWKHEGIVVTDWGACNDRVAGLIAGQELEMPSSGDYNDSLIVKSVQDGSLSEGLLNSRVERILDLILKSKKTLDIEHIPYNKEEHHSFARKVAGDSIVLLKNEENILPLNQNQTVALIGEFAVKPRYQGSGSSLINPTKIANAFDTFKKVIGNKVSYSQGYHSKDDVIDGKLVAEAVENAKNKDVVVVMVGLTDLFESEGFDRDHLNIPNNHLDLIDEISKVNKNIVIALSNGSPILIPFKDKAMAIVEQYLGGQASGEALVDVLYGTVNPNGKLAETFPNSIDEFPSNQNFPGLPRQVEYREGLYVGYRYYDTVNLEPLYPFGFGLSYTNFEYSNLSVKVGKEVLVTFDITNTGSLEGKEIAQVYITKDKSNVYRPKQELKGYVKVNLVPKETKTVTIKIHLEDLKVYNIDSFKLEEGEYAVLVGASSKDIRMQEDISLKGTKLLEDSYKQYKSISLDFAPTKENFEEILGFKIPEYPSIKPYTMNSVIGELQGTIVGRQLKKIMSKEIAKMAGANDDVNPAIGKMAEKMIEDLPFRGLVMLGGDTLSRGRAEGLLDIMNKKPIRGIFKSIKG